MQPDPSHPADGPGRPGGDRSPEVIARGLCDRIAEGMRAMGVITTAHYDAGMGLIADAIRREREGEPKPAPPEPYPGLKEAAQKFANQYMNSDWLIAVVQGGGEITVYTRSNEWPDDLPMRVDGWPVVVKAHGPMATMGGPLE